MAQTLIGLNDAKAVKRFSVALAAETWQRSFWGRNFAASDGSQPLHRITELESNAGDQVTADLFVNLTGLGIEGDNTLKGNEEALSAHTMNFWIDQLRHGVSVGGKMTRKRTVHDLRMIGKEKLSIWWSRRFDEELFIYAAGVRGAETGDWLLPTTYTGRANNSLTAMDSTHILRVNSRASDGTLVPGDLFSMGFLEDINYQLKKMANAPKPIMMNGQEKYILILHPTAEKQLRQGSSTAAINDWAQLKKYTMDGQKQIWGEALGGYGKLVLFSHPKIPVVNNADDGAGVDDKGCVHNLLLGAQAMMFATGQAGGPFKFDWHEEQDDRGNLPVIDTGTIFGVQRAIWNSLSFSVMSCRSHHVTAVS